MSDLEEIEAALTISAEGASLQESRSLLLTRDFLLAVAKNFDKADTRTKEVVKTTIESFASAFVICFAPHFKEKCADDLAAGVAAHIEAALAIKLKYFDEFRPK